MSVTTERQWFLLTSKPHKDELAELQLRNQGFDVYRPLAQRLRKQRGRVITCVESLFPRYMFIHLNSVTDNWTPIRSTKGVHGLVRFGASNLPTPVPEQLIWQLQAQEKALGQRAIDLDRFHAGDKVVITEGPFHGLQAVFQKYDGEERVIVLLDILHKTTKYALSPAHLAAA